MSGNSFHLVFTYGTLKRGEPNHQEMLNKDNGTAEFLGCGETKDKYPLVVATRFNVPFMMKVEGLGQRVRGELYSVDDKMLEYLDRFEYHPRLYLRQEVAISLTEDKDGHEILPAQSKNCWTYFLSKTKDDWHQLKYLSDYKSKSGEFPPYVVRTERDSEIKICDLVFPPS